MMTNIKLISFVLLTVMIGCFCSCKRYLEKPFGVNFNEDSVFARMDNAQKLVNSLYGRTPYYITASTAPNSGPRLNGSLLDCATDLGCSFRLQPNYIAHRFNNGTIDAEFLSNNAMGEDVYKDHYKTIRIAFTLLDRIGEVPDASIEQKERIKAESQTMIAFEYFQLMKRYGGVPLVKDRLDPQTDDINLPRSPLSDVYGYIIEMLDAAIANPHFAARYDGIEFGRLTKAFAYGLKARAALWAASPLFNTDQPYLSLGEHNNLICLMAEDPARWQIAEQYAKEAISFCESNGYAIVNTPDVNLNYTISYQYLPSQGNTEVMWGNLGLENPNMAYWLPRGTPFSGYSPNMPTQNLVEKYQNRDGSSIDWTSPITTAPNDPASPYKNLDPRFKQTVMYNGLEVYPGAVLNDYNHDNASLNGSNGPAKANAQFAYVVRKHVYGYEDRMLTKKTWHPMAPEMRLTELYFIYAEARNEALTLPDERVYEKINIIRHRSGMREIPLGLTKDEMRAKIQDEYAIEFAFEEYRFFDLKRWKSGDTFKGPIYDLKVIKHTDNTYTYTRYKYEDRVYHQWYYLHPFPPSEVLLQYGLVQNPGW